MKLLLTGANGQIGHEIMDLAKKLSIDLHAATHQQLDITQRKLIQQWVSQVKPQYIINAAAYTSVDKAETEKEIAFAVNATAVRYLAEVANKFNIPLLHISTDYVFDGRKKIPYVEEDSSNPLSIYGQSKRLGEIFLQEICTKHIILRVSWVFGCYGNNFVKSILKAAKTESELQIVCDQVGAPTYAGDIAQVLLRIIELIELGNERWGTYHFSGTPVLSWYQFAQIILEKGRQFHSFTVKNVLPIAAAAYPCIAKRPYNSQLNISKIQRTFGIETKNWKAGLNAMLKKNAMLLP